jgi:hypothetical protein
VGSGGGAMGRPVTTGQAGHSERESGTALKRVGSPRTPHSRPTTNRQSFLSPSASLALKKPFGEAVTLRIGPIENLVPAGSFRR